MKDRAYFEIRLESLGGLGANLCGKMLGELGVKYLGLNGAAFSSYGSEKRGSPVSSFIRWCEGDKEILINSPVREPDILGIFQENILIKYPWPDILEMPRKIVVNTRKNAEALVESYPWLSGYIYYLDGISIAMQTKGRMNMIMLGAMMKALEDEEIVEGNPGEQGMPGGPDRGDDQSVSGGGRLLACGRKLIEETVGKKYPDLLEINLNGFMAGHAMVQKFHRKPESSPEGNPMEDSPDGEGMPKVCQEKLVWGYENAPIGGANPLAGSMASNDLSPSRSGYMPLFDESKCIHCGLCDSTCPDMVFQFKKGTYKGKEQMMNRGLDYHYCKGCLRCVAVCPVNALVAGVEAEHPNPQWFVADKDLVASNIHWTQKASDGWITGESYMSERRNDGGVR